MSAMCSEILSLVKQRDYDRYLCSLFAGKNVQPHLFALLAFNAEIAPVAEVTSEAITGAVRLKWWSDALDEIYSDRKVREHQVVQALADTIKEHGLERAAFEQMIEARGLDLEVRQGFDTSDEFERYLQDTAGCLHQLIARVCMPDISDDMLNKVQDLAQCYALVGLLRALPYHVERGMIRWPRDVLQRYGVSPAAIANDKEREAVAQFVAHWVDRAIEHDAPALPKALNPLTLMHHVACSYAKQLKRANYDLGQMPVRLPSLPMALWWRSLTG